MDRARSADSSREAGAEYRVRKVNRFINGLPFDGEPDGRVYKSGLLDAAAARASARAETAAESEAVHTGFDW